MFNHWHCDGIADGHVALDVADTFCPVVGKTLQSLTLHRSEFSYLGLCFYKWRSAREDGWTDSLGVINPIVLMVRFINRHSCWLCCLLMTFIYSRSNKFLAWAGDRKYIWSGCSSKMSDNENSLSVLGHPKMFAVKHLPLEIIPKVIQDG